MLCCPPHHLGLACALPIGHARTYSVYMSLGRGLAILCPLPFPRYYRTGIDISLFRKLSDTTFPMDGPNAYILYVAHLSHNI